MNARHSSASNLWYTPAEVIEMAREVLGEIDLDPACDAVANQTVRATYWRACQGEEWGKWPLYKRVWCNPPGGKNASTGASNQKTFWKSLMTYRSEGLLVHAIFLAFSVESLQTTQRDEQPAMMDFPICIPHKRIRFVSPTGKKNSPTHANALIYVPGTIDRTDDFIRVFSALGACKR